MRKVIARTCLVLSLLAMLPPAARSALPEPPQQRKPWKPPKAPGIPDHVIRASATLFDMGLADPRGGEYREVQLPGPDEESVETHGWVFEGRYTVCWNGLVYPVQSVGPRADLAADVRLIATMHLGDLPYLTGLPTPDVVFWTHMQPPGTRIAPLSLALLLRLGKAGLAGQLWQAIRKPNALVQAGALRNGPQWTSAATEAWLVAAFRRVINERTRGDDLAAMATAESLLGWEQRVRASRNVAGDFSFLEPVLALLADSDRRAHEPARPKLGFEVPVRYPDEVPAGAAAFLAKPQAERIAELIDRLEDVHVEKFMWPGSLEYMDDPVCRLLAAEGEAAVEPLLNAYDRDQRLTRTVDFARPWSRAGRPVPVTDAIRDVLGSILRNPGLVERSSPGELRLWWAQHREMSPLDRAYELLASDTGTPDEWVDAADTITLRSDIRRVGGFLLGGCVPGKPTPTAAGEPLRERRSPSVSELLVRRTAELADSELPYLACRMALMAYLWDPGAASPALARVGSFPVCQEDAQVTVARIDVGDPTAADQWVALIRKKVAHREPVWFDLEPFWMFPDNPKIAKLSDWLFAHSDSPPRLTADPHFAGTPLLTIPAFRRAVGLALYDNTLVPSPTKATGEQPATVRVKDLVASRLSEIDGFPEFKLDWPETDRDRAVSEIGAFLSLHQSELRAFPGKPRDVTCHYWGDRVYLDR